MCSQDLAILEYGAHVLPVGTAVPPSVGSAVICAWHEVTELSPGLVLQQGQTFLGSMSDCSAPWEMGMFIQCSGMYP